MLTIWPSEDHRRLGGDAICAATGLLTRSGTAITLDGRRYPPTLSRGIKCSRMWSTVAQSISVSLLWDRDSQSPVDLDLRYAVGELALVDETTGGTAVVGWSQRLRLVSGRVSSYKWGDDYEVLELTLSGTQLIDTGDWYLPGAELSSDRFPDIANEGDRDRARNSDGLLPPKVWAPVGTAIRVPALVVRDEDDAVSGVSDIGYRRYLLGYDPPSQTAADEQFQQRDADREGQWLGGSTDSVYRATPTSTTDALGDTYWYVVGDFVESFGNASVSFAIGSDLATVARARRFCREGWQIKGSTGGADDYLVAISNNGGTFELGDSSGSPVGYGGPAVVNGTGNSVPLPPDTADGTVWLPSVSGGHRGISQITDVLIDWLKLAKFDVPIAFGDLQALRSRLTAWALSYVRRERGSPWAKVQDVLSYAPIRAYLHDGVLRFRWSGLITDQDIVATIDLDDERGMYRAEPLQWDDEPVYPVIVSQHWWDIPDQKFMRTVSIDAVGGVSGVNQRVTCGRAQRAYAEWREVSGCRRREQAPSLTVELDTIEASIASRLAPLWLLYKWGMGTHRMTVAVDATWRWLEPGHAVRVVQTGATRRSQRWWVEGVTYDGAGVGELLLSGVRA